MSPRTSLRGTPPAGPGASSGRAPAARLSSATSGASAASSWSYLRSSLTSPVPRRARASAMSSSTSG
eukprot:12624576-Alexandrium_andersonii.AAC.1